VLLIAPHRRIATLAMTAMGTLLAGITKSAAKKSDGARMPAKAEHLSSLVTIDFIQWKGARGVGLPYSLINSYKREFLTQIPIHRFLCCIDSIEVSYWQPGVVTESRFK
jgi:hypothetical protein